MKEFKSNSIGKASNASAHHVGNLKSTTANACLQAKLTIGAVNDPLEYEADNMADKILGMHQPPLARPAIEVQPALIGNASCTGKQELFNEEPEQESDEEQLPDMSFKHAFDTPPFSPPSDPHPNNPAAAIHRKCAACEHEKRADIYRSGLHPKTPEPGRNFESYVSSLGSSGAPLSKEDRDYFEPRFEYDFSNVRVHTDSAAATSAESINALAYTTGPHIVFNNQYTPGTTSGKRLMAHELTHTIQQGASTRKPIQRQEADPLSSDTSSPAPMANQSILNTGTIGPAIPIDMDTAKALVREFNEKLGDVATRVIPFPEDEAIASNEPEEPEDLIQTFPDVSSSNVPLIQRSEGSRGAASAEAGVVGSIQVCFDFCTGDVRVVGWIWGGAGVETPLGWYGAFAFYERTFFRGNLGLGHISCGTCDPECTRAEHGDAEFGGGLAGFPVVINPGERASLRQAGLEVGFLLTPHSLCDADLELIALLDLIQYLGPPGAVISRFIAAAHEIADRLGVHFECQLGIDVSGIIHLCKSTPGGGIMGITSDRAEVCGGGYAACGFGLSRDRSSLPH